MPNNQILNIAMFGETEAGKTELCRTLSGLDFNGNYNSTVGVDFVAVFDKYEGNTIKYALWDFSGDRKYTEILKNLRDRSEVAVYVLDSTIEAETNKRLLMKNKLLLKTTIFELIVFTKTDLPTSKFSKNYVEAFNEFELPSMSISAKEDHNNKSKARFFSYFNGFYSKKVSMGKARVYSEIINILESAVFDQEKIKEVKELIQLVKKQQEDPSSFDQFEKQAIFLIGEVRAQVLKHSLAWKSLDVVVCLLALIVTPFAIVNCFYNKVKTGKFKLNFFRTSEGRDNLNWIEAQVLNNPTIHRPCP